MEEHFFKFKCFANLSRFPEIIQGVSTRAYGSMKFGGEIKEAVENNRKHFCDDLKIKPDRMVTAGLIHGNKIISVTRADKGKIIKSADGLITQDKDIYLMVTIADCLPILIYEPVIGAVAVLHAGWRSIIQRIVKEVLEKFRHLGSDSDNIIVGIGPGICQKHFVVKDDCLEQFKEFYPQATFVRNHDGYVDLKRAVRGDLEEFGIPKLNIETSYNCPVCHNGIYGSFRKEGEGAPASAAVIGMRE